ncbi:hypothetical protein O181_102156 [Austropuccinia psidii MF-1]|uniref:Uncharacterized protein n=1 Tax=Austropuccinia psidii MF-1 TaxID=1389203 RepID=A0A9Q3JIA8_9BASI|nr:hypothetical protein [Austropuccinia psidii MF-1]
MLRTPNIIHGIFSISSFGATIASLIISIKLGALNFLRVNLLDGFCKDVWDGFFLSPTNLLAITFLMYLPLHCYSINAPLPLLFLTFLMGLPSILFFTGTFLEISPVVLPLGTVMLGFINFGLSELKLAKNLQSNSSENFSNSKNLTPKSKKSIIITPSKNNSLKLPPSPISKRKRTFS